MAINTNQRDTQESKRISGSPPFGQKAITSGDGTQTYTANTKCPCGFLVVADAVVTWTSAAGDVNTSITIPAGTTVVGFINQIQIASGTIVLYFW